MVDLFSERALVFNTFHLNSFLKYKLINSFFCPILFKKYLIALNIPTWAASLVLITSPAPAASLMAQ